MLITRPSDYRVGDIVLFDGGGFTFTILSWLLGRWDKSWRVLKRKPWHTAFLTRKDMDGLWYIGEERGGWGSCESSLDSYDYTGRSYQVFRWLDKVPSKTAVKKYMKGHQSIPYDAFIGYLCTILWFFVRWFPRIIDRKYMCWEFVYDFVATMGKPVEDEFAYPFLTILMDKLDYPGYE